MSRGFGEGPLFNFEKTREFEIAKRLQEYLSRNSEGLELVFRNMASSVSKTLTILVEREIGKIIQNSQSASMICQILERSSNTGEATKTLELNQIIENLSYIIQELKENQTQEFQEMTDILMSVNALNIHINSVRLLMNIGENQLSGFYWVRFNTLLTCMISIGVYCETSEEIKTMTGVDFEYEKNVSYFDSNPINQINAQVKIKMLFLSVYIGFQYISLLLAMHYPILQKTNSKLQKPVAGIIKSIKLFQSGGSKGFGINHALVAEIFKRNLAIIEVTFFNQGFFSKRVNNSFKPGTKHEMIKEILQRLENETKALLDYLKTVSETAPGIQESNSVAASDNSTQTDIEESEVENQLAVVDNYAKMNALELLQEIKKLNQTAGIGSFAEIKENFKYYTASELLLEKLALNSSYLSKSLDSFFTEIKNDIDRVLSGWTKDDRHNLLSNVRRINYKNPLLLALLEDLSLLGYPFIESSFQTPENSDSVNQAKITNTAHHLLGFKFLEKLKTILDLIKNDFSLDNEAQEHEITLEQALQEYDFLNFKNLDLVQKWDQKYKRSLLRILKTLIQCYQREISSGKHPSIIDFLKNQSRATNSGMSYLINFKEKDSVTFGGSRKSGIFIDCGDEKRILLSEQKQENGNLVLVLEFANRIGH